MIMINKKVQEFGGRICNTCQYYDALNGWCKKHKCNRYCVDECDKWRTASDLVEHREKKNKPKIERVSLL